MICTLVYFAFVNARAAHRPENPAPMTRTLLVLFASILLYYEDKIDGKDIAMIEMPYIAMRYRYG